MKDKEYLRPFLSKTIHICDRCGKLDIKTYARYKLKEDNEDTEDDKEIEDDIKVDGELK